MTKEELLNDAIRRFKIIAEDTKNITTANLSHNVTCLRGKALRAYEIIEKCKPECFDDRQSFDEWHKESEESIYNSIMDWGYHRFVCLMKDNTIQIFTGIRDENYNGEIATHINNVDDYDTDDIVMWTEIPRLNES